MPAIAEAKTARNVALPTYDDEVTRYKQRLLEEAGLNVGPPSHFKRSHERPFTRSERDHVTVLFGGLTLRHERMVMAGLQGLGYNVDLVRTPVKDDFQAGREYGNNGQCNPTYFTVGSLVNHLKRLRDEEGISTQTIIDDYVFFTAGACGPCRFGMYEAEYRLALRNSGFDGFRVLLFQQSGGVNQADIEAGLELDLNFFLTLVNALFIGDLLNEVAYHIRPYEIDKDKTNDVFAKCAELCGNNLREKDYDAMHGGTLAKLLAGVAPVKDADDAEKFLDQMRGTYYVDAFKECAELINDEVEVDYTRPKPVVKITGEFWAQTTEGDGNFNMFSFLEGEGAEVLVEPIATWLAYMLNQVRNAQRDRHEAGVGTGAEESDKESRPGRWNLRARWKQEADYRKRMLTLTMADKLINREYDRLRKGLGGTAHELVNQQHLVRLGHPFYNSRSGGGEGHLEVAKNIYYGSKSLAHMVLSLKPFGCMPSTQSDGAQTAVIAKYPDMIYLPVETSGEGDINAHSRVQMALGDAKIKCKEEFKACVARTGYTIDQIRAYVADHRELRRPLLSIPHAEGVVGRAANFVLHVGSLMASQQEAPAVECSASTNATNGRVAV